MKSIAILISGRGSNMEAVVRACAARHWPAQIGLVLSSRRDAPGVEAAAALGVTVACVDSRDFAERAQFETALAREIDALSPQLIVLSGFMRVLSAAFVGRYEGKMLNIHPSLLPAFPGLGTHRQALAAGVTTHGATVHFVTNDLDQGPIVAQARVRVMPGDTEASLAERVLEQEHRLLPLAVECFVTGALRLQAGRVEISGAAAELFSLEGFLITP